MDSELHPSSEMMLYPVFYRTMIQRKIADFNRLWSTSELKELPRQCILHLIDDNFLMNKPIMFAPDEDSFFFSLQPNIKFINHITQPVQGVIKFDEQFNLPSRGLIPTLMNFKKRTLTWIKPWKDISVMPKLLGSQAMISYLSLYRAKIFGQMKMVRRFSYIMTSVLNTVCSIPNKFHFIPIPVGSNEYTKADFVPSFKTYSKATIRYPNDPWYLFCMHLFGFMHGCKHSLFSKIPENMRSYIHLVFYTDKNILISNLDNLIGFNKGSLDVVLIRFIKQLNELARSGQALSITDFGDVTPAADTETTSDLAEATEEDINDDTSLEKPIVVKPVQRTEPVPTRLNIRPTENEDESVTRQKMPSPRALLAEKAKRFSRLSKIGDYSKIVDKYKRFLNDNNLFGLLKNESISRDELIKNINQLISLYNDAPKVVEAPKTSTTKPTGMLRGAAPTKITKGDEIAIIPGKPSGPTEVVEATKIESELLNGMPVVDEMDNSVVKFQPKLINNGKDIVNAPAYTKGPSKEQQKVFDTTATEEIDTRASEAILAHTELTQAQTDRAIKLSQLYKTVEYNGRKLEDIINSSPSDSVSNNELDFLKDQVPDKSMLKSSIDNFDVEYMKNYFLRDLVLELTSFNKCGMFLKDFKMDDISDSMNNMYEVTAKYEDLNHKQHTIRFSIPKVDSRGYCYINGSLKVLKKQRITNPICKVSPTRVTLSSDYNKYLVERATTVAHSFINYIDKIVSTVPQKIEITYGTAKLATQTYPYEFTAISRKYTTMTVTDENDQKNKWYFYFNSDTGLLDYFIDHGFGKESIKDALDNEDDVKGYLIGMQNPSNPTYVYMKIDGSIVVYNSEDGINRTDITFIDLLCEICNIEISHLSEWTELKLLSKAVPTIFALAYKYGLSYMLNYTKCKYFIYDKKARYPRKQSDVIVKFKDKVLIVPRAPLAYSLLFAGLNNYDLTKYNIEDMDGKDVYFDLLQSKKMSVHTLKGIDNFFDLFVDPITKDVLFRMGEPTNSKDLLIRATALLTTEDYPPVAASTNYRFRSYERICTAVYKTLANTYSTYRFRGLGASNTFSIKDFEISNAVISDQLMEPVDQINPINDIKYREEYGHGGSGGRQSTDTFMIDDRKWPDDGVGIIGESSVDNGKTGYAGTIPNNPTLDNVRGLTINKKISDIEPSEAFTCTSLLGPCVLQDDSKRISFLNIHLSHFVATKETSLPRVRTGFERVVAHRCRLPFSYAAEYDGTIEKIDEDSHMLVVYYPTEKKRVAIEYGDLYTNNGGGGFFCTQNIIINGFKQGDKVKRGDVIIYNEKFFKADPFNKQVDMSFGILANTVIIDTANTVEDSSVISGSLAEKMMFNPVHPRDIVITKSTAIHKYAAVGTKVNNTDPLMIFDQSAVTDDMFGGLDEEATALLGAINRKTPKAKFTGTVVKIDAFYIGDTSSMSQSAKNLVNAINRDKAKRAAVSKGAENESDYPSSTSIKVSTRIGTTVLDEDTLIIRFYIQQDMSMNAGDKLEFDSSLKSVCAGAVDEGWEIEDGSLKCDALFSAVGINKRIINSPMLTGIANRCLEKIEKDVLKMYFE